MHTPYTKLRERIAVRANLRHKQIDGAFAALVAELHAMSSGDTLTVRDLGKFTKITRAARRITSITGEVVTTKAKDAVTFKAQK